jgi:hypothetical protein
VPDVQRHLPELGRTIPGLVTHAGGRSGQIWRGRLVSLGPCCDGSSTGWREVVGDLSSSVGSSAGSSGGLKGAIIGSARGDVRCGPNVSAAFRIDVLEFGVDDLLFPPLRRGEHRTTSVKFAYRDMTTRFLVGGLALDRFELTRPNRHGVRGDCVDGKTIRSQYLFDLFDSGVGRPRWFRAHGKWCKV